MTDLRDVIARAIYASDFDIPAGELEEQWAWSAARSSYQNNADAVIAVLAYPPADVIEQAAIELFRDSWGDRPSAVKAGVRWNWLHDEEKQYWRSKVGLVFAAVFGGEQGE